MAAPARQTVNRPRNGENLAILFNGVTGGGKRTAPRGCLDDQYTQ